MRIKYFFAWLAFALGIVTTFISGWSLLEYWFKENEYLSYLANGYIIFLTFLVIVFACVRQFQTIRKERYPNIMPALHMALHATRDLETYLLEKRPTEDSSAEEFELYLSVARRQVNTIMNHLARIFSSLTSTNCRACVKLTYSVETEENQPELYVYAYARDEASSQLCRKLDGTRINSNHDLLENNPQFAEICSLSNNDKWYFSCNNLLKLSGFASTSLNAYNPEYHKQFDGGSLSRLWKDPHWPLPYKSCVACVIRQSASNLIEDREDDVLGYVSVDSESRGVFVERWDKEIVFAIADTLFWPLKHIISVEREAEKLELKSRYTDDGKKESGDA